MHWRRYAADPHLAGFLPLAGPGTRMLVRTGYETHVELLGLHGAPATGGETVAGGRASHAMVPLPTGERAVVRVYRRGGMLRHLNRERYFLGHRAFAELRATEVARANGVRTPLPLAAVERSARIGYTALFATRWVPGSRDGASWLREADPSAARALLRQAGEQIGRMHAAGVAHPDLNLRNLLVAQERGEPTATVYLLDFDRARVYRGPVPTRRRARDLLRLARSARKLRMPLGHQEWSALREGYGVAWPLPELP
ncbi:MAG TPA: lipopolysaccharide kinase InaA family protein [Longimicrobiaceae bacterium]|nr:lipopolysaccharide kinase InaA family protein [Longimicrobiaceae bacterium]